MHAQAVGLYQAGLVKESLAGLEQARAEFLAQGDRVQAAAVANDLGVVYYTQGRRDEARKIFDEAIAVFEQAAGPSCPGRTPASRSASRCAPSATP